MFALKPWLVVFDLDGTLIDSSLDLCNAVNAALASVGRSPLPHATISGYIGDGAAALVQRALAHPSEEGEKDVDKRRFQQAFDAFLAFYRAHKLDNTRLHDGVHEALLRIRTLAPTLPMAVLTNKPVRPSREICTALGVAPFFFANYGGDSFRTKKPDPAGLLQIMEEGATLAGARRGELPASGVVMVGDADVDVHTARGAGALSLGCQYGLAPEAMLAAKPDMVCGHPREWPALLGLEAQAVAALMRGPEPRSATDPA